LSVFLWESLSRTRDVSLQLPSNVAHRSIVFSRELFIRLPSTAFRAPRLRRHRWEFKVNCVAMRQGAVGVARWPPHMVLPVSAFRCHGHCGEGYRGGGSGRPRLCRLPPRGLTAALLDLEFGGLRDRRVARRERRPSSRATPGLCVPRMWPRLASRASLASSPGGPTSFACDVFGPRRGSLQT